MGAGANDAKKVCKFWKVLSADEVATSGLHKQLKNIPRLSDDEGEAAQTSFFMGI